MRDDSSDVFLAPPAPTARLIRCAMNPVTLTCLRRSQSGAGQPRPFPRAVSVLFMLAVTARTPLPPRPAPRRFALPRMPALPPPTGNSSCRGRTPRSSSTRKEKPPSGVLYEASRFPRSFHRHHRFPATPVPAVSGANAVSTAIVVSVTATVTATADTTAAAAVTAATVATSSTLFTTDVAAAATA